MSVFDKMKGLSITGIVSLFAVCLLVISVIWIVVSVIQQFVFLDEQITQKEHFVEKLESVAEKRNLKNSENGAEQEISPFLTASSKSIAAATLQGHLTDKLQDIGVSPSSLEILYPAINENLPDAINRVQIQIQFELSEADLSALLVIAEAKEPVLEIDRLLISSAKGSGSSASEGATQEWQRLDITLSISGYWRELNDS